MKHPEWTNVPSNAIITIMTTHLFTKFLPLLTNRFMPILATPCRLLAHKRRPELLTRLPPGWYKETEGSPKFLWNLHCPFAPVLRPRSDWLFRPLRKVNVVPSIWKLKTPTIRNLSRLDSRAFGLAVYASPWGLLAPDAKLASAGGSDLDGQARPARFSTKVLNDLTLCHRSSFLQDSWRKHKYILEKNPITTLYKFPKSFDTPLWGYHFWFIRPLRTLLCV